MNRIILLSILCTLCTSVFGENFYLDLSSKYLELENPDFYVEKVVNVASEKNCIGYIQRSISAKIIPVFFSENTETTLTKYLNRSIPKNSKHTPLHIQVNKIFVSEATYANKEMVVASASLSFYEKTEGGYIELFTACHSLTRNVIDATSAHANNLSKCLSTCFQLFQARKKANLLSRRFIPAAEMGKITFFPQDYSITQGPTMRKAIYHSYNDFLYNTPDTLTNFSIGYSQNGEPDQEATKIYFEKAKDKKDVWGFCDGTNIYIKRFGTTYSPLFFENGNYYIWAAPPPSQNELNEAFMSEVFVGVLGGALLAGVAGGISAVALDKPKVKYFLDYSTAEFAPADRKIVYEAKTFICHSLFSDDTKKVEVWRDGKKQAELQKDTYYEIITNSEVDTLNITLKVGDISRSIMIEPTLFSSDALLCKVSKNGKLREIWLNSEEKAGIYKQIMNKEFKKVE